MRIMTGRTARQLIGLGVVAISLGVLPASGQKLQKIEQKVQQQFVTVEQPDAEQTKREFGNLLDKYPPTLRGVFREDPTLLTQEQYLAPYPALANFLNTHPEVAHNPSYYLDGLAGEMNGGRGGRFNVSESRGSRVMDMWERLLTNLEIFAGFGIAIGLLTWLIRTFLDYRRWNRLSKVQAEVHTKLMERFGTNEELMAYIGTPAGSRFLQSAPISLDTGARSMGAPLSRIMWSLQAGLVLAAAGCGLMLASGRVGEDAYLPLEIMGILSVALGVGFAVSAGVSFVLSHRMGLIEPAAQKRTPSTSSTLPLDPPEAQ